MARAVALEMLDVLRSDPELRQELQQILGGQDAEKMLDTREVGDRLGKHPKTVERWCREGRLDGAVKVGETWRVPPESLNDVRPSGVSPIGDAAPARRPNRTRAGGPQRSRLLRTAPRNDPRATGIAGGQARRTGDPMDTQQATDQPDEGTVVPLPERSDR